MQMVIRIQREEEEEISSTSLKNHARLWDVIQYCTHNVNQRWLFNQKNSTTKDPVVGARGRGFKRPLGKKLGVETLV